MPFRSNIFFHLAIAALLTACGPLQPAFLTKPTPHEKYGESLKKAGLENTGLANAWTAAAARALNDTIEIPTPFQETAYFPADEPLALGYRIAARRGERITVRADVEASAPVKVFIDVFQIDDDEFDHVVSAEDGSELEFVADRDRIHIVRIQPELLQSASITVTIVTGASMEFPVSGLGSKAIKSFFGDARDGGRRRHEGVDVFAPRGTPLIAVANGVARAANNRLGGKVVWLHDTDRGLNLYYAHLDSQYVGALQMVKIGDTLGTVGNSGNAEHTPPHLHFGIYARGEGAVDPLPFLNTPLQDPAPITADLEMLHYPARVRSKNAELRLSTDRKAASIVKLPQHTYVPIIAASGDRFRVRHGSLTGYVNAKDVVPIEKPLRSITLDTDQRLMDAAQVDAAPIKFLQKGEEVELLAESGSFRIVRTVDREVGWIVG